MHSRTAAQTSAAPFALAPPFALAAPFALIPPCALARFFTRALPLVLAIFFTWSLSCVPSAPAYAAELTDIEIATQDYEDAERQLDEVNERIAEIQAEIDELEKQIPVQQERSDEAIRLRYIMQENPLSVIETLLGAQTLDEFLKQTEYVNIVSKANLDEINRLKDLHKQMEDARAEQQRLQEEAQAAFDEAEFQLQSLQSKRQAKQATGVGNARAQANTQGGEASVGVAADGGEQPEDFRVAAMPDTGPLADGANWYASKDEFIDEWTARIDRYLAGSALAGHGLDFATAAWKYCIDPRWAPAISNTESSKGAHCIRPHNAWGWGAADSDPYRLASEWGSWEEAIDSYVSQLSYKCGYTITMNVAKSYCPNTWQSWYNKTLTEMSRI